MINNKNKYSIDHLVNPEMYRLHVKQVFARFYLVHIK